MIRPVDKKGSLWLILLQIFKGEVPSYTTKELVLAVGF